LAPCRPTTGTWGDTADNTGVENKTQEYEILIVMKFTGETNNASVCRSVFFIIKTAIVVKAAGIL
jgi:hypothetical protein